MRIIGGQFKGRKLTEFPGEEIRPTGDRVKESLFNILSMKLYGARVLDLFCGSGALGLESLSRGAAFAHFNDAAKSSLDILRKNLALVKADAALYKVTNQDYMQCLSSAHGFDVIFVDPPYRMDFGAQALKTIAERKILNENGVIVYERDRHYQEEIPSGLTMYDERKYGKTYLTFFSWGDQE
jgi:16S rRNA (guanine966-N2)-methyltransferase